MKVLILNGSPRVKGNTSIALDEMVKIFSKEGIETDVRNSGNRVAYYGEVLEGPVIELGRH